MADDLEFPDPTDRLADTITSLVTSAHEESETRLPVFSDDRFVDTEHIGAGSNADIFSARDENLGRRVVLKFAAQDAMLAAAGHEKLAELGIEEGFAAIIDETRAAQGRYSLLREARLLAQIEHPNVISVLDVGRMSDGAVAVVLPLLSGGTLDEQEPGKRWQEVLEVALQIGEGLAALHRAGLIHRDFKPNNVLFDAYGHPRIADLGLGCKLDDEEAMAEWVGTGRYMSPEVIERRFRDQRDDLYAYCVAMFELFYGHSPFASIEARLAGEVSDIRRPGGMSPKLRAALVRGLHPDASKRWPNMRALLGQMRRATMLRRASVVAVIGVVLGAGAGVGMLASASAKADACEEVSDELARFWTRDTQSELRGAFGTRVAGDRMQNWAARWAAVRTHECDAAKQDNRSTEPSVCTAKVRDRFAATIEAFRTPHLRKGLRFGDVIAELPPPEHCIAHPDDGEWGEGGLLELSDTGIDSEVAALVLMGDLDNGRVRQQDYMDLARELRSEYGITRAVFWRGEIGRLDGQLDDAIADFEMVYADAQELGVPALGAEALMRLAAIAGVRGDISAVNAHALAARAVFARQEPHRVAQLLQVQGLALLSGPAWARERGVELLADAIELREDEVRQHVWGTRELLSQAHEDYAKGLLAVHRAAEALEYLELALRAHQVEFGYGTGRTHGILREKFAVLVEIGRLEDADATGRRMLENDVELENWARFSADVVWLADTYLAAERPHYAMWVLRLAREKAVELGLVDDVDRIDTKLAGLIGE